MENKKRPRLTQSDIFKVYDWLSNSHNWNDCLTKTRKEVIEAIKLDTGVSISPRAILSICKDMGKEQSPWRIVEKRKKRMPPSHLWTDRPRFLAQQMLHIIEEIRYIQAELGISHSSSNVDENGVLRISKGQHIQSQKDLNGE